MPKRSPRSAVTTRDDATSPSARPTPTRRAAAPAARRAMSADGAPSARRMANSWRRCATPRLTHARQPQQRQQERRTAEQREHPRRETPGRHRAGQDRVERLHVVDDHLGAKARTASRIIAAECTAGPSVRTTRSPAGIVDCAAGSYKSYEGWSRPRYRTSATTPTTRRHALGDAPSRLSNDEVSSRLPIRFLPGPQAGSRAGADHDHALRRGIVGRREQSAAEQGNAHRAKIVRCRGLVVERPD